MTKLNAITDIVLVVACIWGLLHAPIVPNAFPAFACGFGSIALAAALGAMWFNGVQEVRKYHLLMIHISSSLGIIGIALGHTMFALGVSQQASMIVLATLTLFLLYVYYEKPDINLTWLPIVTIFALAAFCFVNSRWKTLLGVVSMIGAVKAKERHVKVWKFDEIDVFHLILSLGMFFLTPEAIQTGWW